MAGPLTTEPFAPRLASKIRGWDGVEGVAGFFCVNYLPGPEFHYKFQTMPGIRTRRNGQGQTGR